MGLFFGTPCTSLLLHNKKKFEIRGRLLDWVWEAGRGGDGGLRTGHEIGTLCGGPGPVSRDLRGLTGNVKSLDQH